MKIKPKPQWLRKKISPKENLAMKRMLGTMELHTICEEALCPNISECFQKKQASFLILGNICTRKCRFCNVDTGVPKSVDPEEPTRVAKAVTQLGLNFVVVTSPTRDDLDDGGAGQFHDTILAIRAENPGTGIEVLIPDFKGEKRHLETVCRAKPEIISHNLETVPRLYELRGGADYKRSIDLITNIPLINPEIQSKSGIMLGLGETEDELIPVFKDLINAGCKLLSLGQYLAPSRKHHPVVEYVEPRQFDRLKNRALELGFSHVESSPFVRSSYHAEEYLNRSI